MAMRPPVIAIVGRPNVGKSTLFNRIVKQKKAVVDDQPGVTRDKNFYFVEHYKIPFWLVDTGGISEDAGEGIEAQIVEQALSAIDEADLVLVLFDGQFGPTPDDELVVYELRKRKTAVIFAANKCDGKELAPQAVQFYELGLDMVLALSALHGWGVRELVEALLTGLPNYEALLQSADSQLEERRKQEEEAEKEERQQEIELVEESEPRGMQVYDIDSDEESEFVEGVESEEEEVVQMPNFSSVYIPSEDARESGKYISENKLKDISKAKLFSTSSDFTTLSKSDFSQDDDSLESEAQIEVSIPDSIRLALVGRPNVGKSTLLNRLTGKKSAITSEISGTTRDALDVEITREGQKFTVVDTAGLRKKARTKDGIERFSELRALNAINCSDVCVLLIDATRGITEQDSKIAGLAHDGGRGLMIVVNKWDAIEKNHKTAKEFEESIYQELKFAQYAPILFVSALSGKRCPEILEMAKKIAASRTSRIPTALLNKALRRACHKKPPSMYRSRAIKLYFSAQVESEPPRFALFFNYPKAVHFSYLRYLSNSLREQFDFEGCNIKLFPKKK